MLRSYYLQILYKYSDTYGVTWILENYIVYFLKYSIHGILDYVIS
jgi:hypothetical protein